MTTEEIVILLMFGMTVLLVYIDDKWGRDALAIVGLAIVSMTGMVAFLAAAESLAQRVIIEDAIGWCAVGILITISLGFLVDFGRRKGYKLIGQKLSPRTLMLLAVALLVGMAFSTRSDFGRSFLFEVGGQPMSADFISHIIGGAVVFVILFDILDEITPRAKIFAFLIMMSMLGIMEIYDWSAVPLYGSYLDCVTDVVSNAVGGGIMLFKVKSFLYHPSGEKRGL